MKKITVLALSFIFGLVAVLAILTAYIPHAGAAEISVPANHSTIQGAINAAANGDVIIVAPGIYVENINFSGKAITVRSTDPNDPAVVADTVIDGGGSDSVVTFKSGERNDSVLCGVTVRNGEANDGGGIYCSSNSSPTISNCTISGNSASSRGGGIYCLSSSPSITNCTISGNSVNDSGGGMFCRTSSPTISNCTISGNSASSNGGGIYWYYSSPSITNCTISGNQSRNGGGILCTAYSSPSITNCTISGNSASSSGGGIYCLSSSRPSITTCTISGNSSTSGGGIYCFSSSPTIANCILWGNLSIKEICVGYGDKPTVTYSDITGGYTGKGNIDANPLFVDSNAGDYRLQYGSPCIDAGDPNAPALPLFDKDGNPRVINEIPDMGAYEYIALVNHAPTINPVADKTVREGELLTFSISAFDLDPNDILTYVAVGLPDGASFDSETQVFSWQPDYEQAGDYLITFRVTDNGGPPSRSDSEEVAISVIDADGPRVISHVPSGGIAPPINYIDIHFNKAINPDSVEVEDVFITGPLGAIIPDSVSQLEPNSFRIAFPEQRFTGEYQLVIGPQILGLDDNPMDQDEDHINGEETEDQYTIDLTILAGLRITGHMPNEDQIEPVNAITVTFNQEINPATFTLDDIVITGPSGMVEVTSGPILVEGTTFQIGFPEQRRAGVYHIYFGPEIENLDGLFMDLDQDGIIGEEIEDLYDASFAIIDAVGPHILSSSPSGNVNPPVNYMDIVFDEEIDTASFEGEDVSIIGPGGAVTPTSINFLDSMSFKIIFSPQTLSGIYQVVIGPQITDMSENSMDQDEDGNNGEETEDQYTSYFSILPGLRVSGHMPSGDQILPVNSMTFTFSQEIKTATFTQDDIVIIDPSGNIQITGGPLLVEGDTYRIGFSEQSMVGVYHVYVGPQIENSDGLYMDQDGDGIIGEEIEDRYYCAFTIIDAAGPQVVSHSPSGSIKPPVDYVDISFNEPIDPNSFKVEDIGVIGPFGEIIPEAVNLLEETEGMVFRVEFPAQEDEGNYQFIIGPYVLDAAGNPMNQDNDWINGEAADDRCLVSFAIDTTGPKILTNSISGLQNVPVQSFDLTFSEEIKATSFTKEAVSIIGPAGDIELLGVTAITSDTFRITFNPSQTDGAYNVIVEPEITDTAGNKLDQDEDGRQGESTDDRYEFEFIQELPDLIVTEISYPLEARPGDQIDVTWTVANNGLGQATGQWTDTVFISEDPEIGGDINKGSFLYNQPLEAGQAYTRTITITLSDEINVNRWIIVKADSQNELGEHGAGTNNATVGASPIWITTRPYPDLQVTQVIVTSAALGAGEQVTISWTVENKGNAATNASNWYDNLYLSLDPTIGAGDIKLGSIRNPDFLAPGEAYTQIKEITIPSSTKPSFYYLLVKTDAEDKVEEFDLENNNVAQGANTVEVITPEPGCLTVTSIEVPDSVVPGSRITFTWTVKNTGGSTIYPKCRDRNTGKFFWDDGAALSRDPVYDDNQDHWLGGHLVHHSEPLAPGETYTYTRTARNRLPRWEPGTYYLILIPATHPYCVKDDIIKSSGVTPVTLKYHKPDLHVFSLNIPTVGASGQQIEVSWSVENMGEGQTSTDSWLDTLFLSSDQILDENDQEFGSLTHQGALDVDQSYEVTDSLFNLPAGIEGSYYIIIKTDNNNAVDESDEDNNVLIIDTPITISLINSDLQIQSTTAPLTGEAGKPVTVQWTVVNAGAETTTVNQWKDRGFLSSDENLNVQEDRFLGEVQHSGALGSGSAYTMVGDYNLPQDFEGTYYLIILTDADDDLYEHDAEDNNIWCVSPALEISNLAPDLEIESFTAPAAGIAGQSIQVDWTVVNKGTATASAAWSDALYLSENNTFEQSDTPLGSFNHSEALAAGASYGGQETITLPVRREGVYYLILFTDKNNSVYEKGLEDNNISTQLITITELAPDLEVENFTVPAAGIAGQSIQVDWTVANKGTAAAIADWSDALYLSENNTFEQSDTPLASFNHSETLAAGASYGRQATITLPVRREGAYYLILFTDKNNSVYEKGLEDNNISQPQPITLTELAPDLEVEDFTAPATGIAGQSIQVDWTVANKGTAAAFADWLDALYLSDDDVLDIEADILLTKIEHTENLLAEESYGPLDDANQILIPDLPNHREGDYYLFFFADANNTVYEKGLENNNISQPQPITLTELAPDLQVQSASAPAQAVADGVIAVDWAIANNGHTAAVGWRDTIYLSEDTEFDFADDRLCGVFDHTKALEPGQLTGPPIQPAFIKVPARLEGRYHLFVVTDTQDHIYEKDTGEENNVFLIPRELEIVIQPADLQVTVVNAPLAAKAGTAVNIDWTVTNRGHRATDETFWKDSVYLSADNKFNPASDILLGTISSSGGLAVEENYSESGSFIIRPDLAGTYYVYVYTDAMHQAYEYNQEDNNITAGPGVTEISGVQADLQVSAISIPESGYQGESISIAWTVTNTGPDLTPGSSWDDTIYLSSDNIPDSGDRTLGTFKHQGGLEGGGSYSVTKTVKMPRDLTGDYYLIVKTDSSRFNDIFEYEAEENNTASDLIAIDLAPTPDLAVINITIPLTAWSGQNMAVSWTVRNECTVPTSARGGFWDDTVYLSKDPYLDIKVDISLGNVRHQGDLIPDETYTQNRQFKLPDWAAGAYYLIIFTDSGVPGHVFERDLEFNNVQVSGSTIQINLTPPADLIINSITPPAPGYYGQLTTWNYEVGNIGDLPARGAWYDTLYLSSDQQWDLEDKRIARIYHQGDVLAGAGYFEAPLAPIPAVVPGNYYLIACTDILDDVRETSSMNNVGVSIDTITVEGRELGLNLSPETGTIARGGASYYQVTAVEGQDLIITLGGAAKDTVELFVACERMPTRSDYDLKGEEDPSGNLLARILGTHAVTYYIMIYGYNCPDPPPSFELSATLPDHSISGFSVGVGGNTGLVTVAVAGYNFSPGTKAFLRDEDGNLIATGVITFKDTGSISVTFDLSGKPPGSYWIELENPDGSLCSKEFEVTEGRGGELYTRVIVPNLVRPGRPYTLTLEYGNIGYADLPAPLMVLSAGGGCYMRLFATEEFHQNPIQVLGIAEEDPVDVLAPGSLYTIEMEFKITELNNVPFYLKIIDQPDEPIDWASVEAALRPENYDSEIWDPMWQNLVDLLGDTWGSYLEVLREDARRLALRGQRIYDVRELFGLEINIAYGGHRGAITGFVYESDTHTPVVGASISAYQPENSGYARAVPESDGSFLLTGLPEGNYELEVEGYLIDEGASADVSVDEDCLDHFVSVTAGGEIGGYVESNGISLEDALISVRGENTGILATARADETGSYHIQGLPEDTYIVKARADGYVEEEKPAFFLPKAEARYDVYFELDKGAEISGLVTDENGQPIENAYVLATNADGKTAGAMTDENGEYLITGLSPGACRISCYVAGYVTTYQDLGDLQYNDKLEGINFNLKAGIEVTGTVYEKDTLALVSGAMLTFENNDGLLAFTYADENGMFSIDQLPKGECMIHLLAHGYEPYEGMVMITEGGLEEPLSIQLTTCVNCEPTPEVQRFRSNDEPLCEEYSIFLKTAELYYKVAALFASKLTALDSILRLPAEHLLNYLGDLGKNEEKAYEPRPCVYGPNDKFRVDEVIKEYPNISNFYTSIVPHVDQEIKNKINNIDNFNVGDIVKGTKVFPSNGDRQTNFTLQFYIVGENRDTPNFEDYDIYRALRDLTIESYHMALFFAFGTMYHNKVGYEFHIKDKVSLGNNEYKLVGDIKYLFWDEYDFEQRGENDILQFVLEQLQICGYATPFHMSIHVVREGSYTIKRSHEGLPQLDPSDPGEIVGNSTVQASHDPNDKLISLGFGSFFHILANDTILYTIRFENDKEATASAQLVTIVDPLSPDLDWSTFELGDMEFNNHLIEVPEGRTYYKTLFDLRPEGNNLLVEIEADFNPSTGVASWTFSGIDPDTGEFTEDVLAGFLPPNGDNHEGEGFVKFKIAPGSDLPTGTKIENVASIVFDWNPPMDTPLVFNTIDIGDPASQVLGLPAESPARFEVIWAGQDDTDGSGIAGYDIYVSENSGEYQLWLNDTKATGGTFAGVGGNTYAFYSVAADNVGNREEAPADPDAFTTALLNSAPSAPTLNLPAHMSEITNSTPILSVNNSLDPDGDALSYEFEIYPNNNLTPPAITSVNGVSGGNTTTSWQCGVNLPKNTWYSWRARAFDGIAYSDWMEANTFYAVAVQMPVFVGMSIQEAINAAGDGDTIIVGPGDYEENINFSGKAITLMSTDPDDSEIVATTIINGGQAGTVITFNCEEGSDSVLSGFTITNGEADFGGGIYCHNSSPTITNCILANNSADFGAGISCDSSWPGIINCIITKNYSLNNGGAIYCLNSSLNLTNCTMSENSAHYGGGLYSDNSSPTITNCILWGDTPDEISEYNSALTIIFSTIQGGYLGTGNIQGDPLFINPEEDDYHLQSDSPCIDSGTNTNAPSNDKDGVSRPWDGDDNGVATCDMGAYEHIFVDNTKPSSPTVPGWVYPGWWIYPTWQYTDISTQ